MQACYELNTSCFRISDSIVYYSDRAVSWTAVNHVSIPDMDKKYFSSPKISDISWGPLSFIFSQPALEDLFLRIKPLGPNLAAHVHLVPKLRVSGTVPPLLLLPS